MDPRAIGRFVDWIATRLGWRASRARQVVAEHERSWTAGVAVTDRQHRAAAKLLRAELAERRAMQRLTSRADPPLGVPAKPRSRDPSATVPASEPTTSGAAYRSRAHLVGAPVPRSGRHERRLAEHAVYVVEHLDDMPEVRDRSLGDRGNRCWFAGRLPHQ